MTSPLLPRPFSGQPLALDLLNTRWMDGGQAVDWLAADGAVESFFDDHGFGHVGDDGESRAALEQARDLIDRFMNAPDDPAVIAEINVILRAAVVRIDSAGPDGPTLSVTAAEPSTAPATAAIVNAVELLGETPGRIRRCDHEDCVLWFLDTSKAGRRRWCSMERCGNRAKAMRHYQRTR